QVRSPQPDHATHVLVQASHREQPLWTLGLLGAPDVLHDEVFARPPGKVDFGIERTNLRLQVLWRTAQRGRCIHACNGLSFQAGPTQLADYTTVDRLHVCSPRPGLMSW